MPKSTSPSRPTPSLPKPAPPINRSLDDLAHAKEHLKRLDKLCLFSCEQYRDLKKAVEAYEKSNGKVKPTTASN